ncbi:prolyl-tRNA synthetase associated domain-containing protein [Atopobacter phocae]|uniref:prolyl-tRNA synthetase associated domain-containing protein n=1 Tax=Atopobacter phocae TaxID=136492 RepID=UPI000471D38E|nr:prolyl-tRNA synthetase associated domain-containing protein [Atopobacter phocae]
MTAKTIIKQLDELSIPYELIEHPPAWTTEEADQFIIGIEGVRTKSLFLTNKKKKNFYLLIMDDSKRLGMDYLAELIGEKRLKFASEELLLEKMNIEPGVVSIFGLIHNELKDIQVLFDEEIMNEERLSFHPNDNTKTIFLKTTDAIKYIEYLSFPVKIITI